MCKILGFWGERGVFDTPAVAAMERGMQSQADPTEALENAISIASRGGAGGGSLGPIPPPGPQGGPKPAGGGWGPPLASPAPAPPPHQVSHHYARFSPSVREGGLLLPP